MPTPSRSLTLVGRRPEMDALTDAYDSARNSSPRFMLIGGEAGIGKSRLLAEFMGDARRLGSTVLEGAAPAVSGPDLPYAPIVAALRNFGDEIAPDQLARLVPAESELSRLLPQGDVGRHDLSPAAGGQLRLYEEFLGFLKGVTGEDEPPVVLALEDLHWADASTRGLLAYLVRNLRSGRVLVLTTFRSTDVTPSSPLQEMLLELERSDSVRHLFLDALTDGDVKALVHSVLGAQVVDERIQRIAHRSGGNPLFIEQLAAGEEQDSEVAPRSLVALLLSAVRRLPDEAQTLVRLAAVAGAAAPAPVLEAAARAIGIELGSAIRAARDAGILAVVPTAGGEVYAYRHPILQEVLYAELPESERARLHGLLAQIIEGLRDPALPHDPVSAIELARHWWAAGNFRQAYPALVRAARAAEEMYAFAEGHQLYERALLIRQPTEQPSDAPPRQIGFRARTTEQPVATDELWRSTAQAASLAGQPERAVELLQARPRNAAAEDATTLGKLGEYLWEAGRRDEALAAYELAVERVSTTDASERATVLRSAARALVMAGRAADALSLARGALATAREAGLEREESLSLNTLAASLALSGAVDEAMTVLDQRCELDERRRRLSGIRPRPSRIVDLLSGYWSQATVLERAGQLEESASVALEGVQRAKELGAQRGWGGLVGAAAVRELTELGRWDEADSLLSDLSSGIAESSGAGAELHAAAARLRTQRGDFREAAMRIEAVGAVDALPPRTRIAVALAVGELAAWSGQLGEGARAVDDALQTIAPKSDRLLLAELSVLALRIAADRGASAAARRMRAERAAIERDAADIYGQLMALDAPEDGLGRGGRKLEAIVATGIAEYRRLGGQPAAGPWATAASLWEALRQPFHAAYARWRAGDALLASKGSRLDGQRELRAAHASCLALGAEPLRREIEGLARRARTDLSPPTVHAAPHDAATAPAAAPTLGLSRRELEVLMLLSEGWTNRRIADALFITEKTAGHHVSSILGKLGVSSRVEAASIAIRAGVVQSAVIATAPEPSVSNMTEAEQPRLTRTLLFSDIVKSTALVEAIGDDAWRDLIGWHDVTLRALFKSYSGTEVDHAGDGFFVVFADVIASLDCAIAIQRTLAAHRKQHGFAPRLRIGIHTAEVTKVGSGYRGKAVHEAARIAAAASPDEVLASSDSLPSSGRYSTLQARMVHLTGLATPTSVVPVSWQNDSDSR